MAKKLSDLFAVGGEHTDVFPNKISFYNELSYGEDGAPEFHETAEFFGNSIEIYTTETGKLDGHIILASEEQFSLSNISFEHGDLVYTFTSHEHLDMGEIRTEIQFRRSEDGDRFSITINGDTCDDSGIRVELNKNDDGKIESFTASFSIDGGWEIEDELTQRVEVKVDSDGYTALYESSGWEIGGYPLLPEDLNSVFSGAGVDVACNILYCRLGAESGVLVWDRLHDTFSSNGTLVSREIHADMSASDALKNPLYDFLEKTVIHYDSGEIREIESCKFDRETMAVEHTYCDVDGNIDRIEIINAAGEIVDVIDGDDLKTDKETEMDTKTDCDITTSEEQVDDGDEEKLPDETDNYDDDYYDSLDDGDNQLFSIKSFHYKNLSLVKY